MIIEGKRERTCIKLVIRDIEQVDGFMRGYIVEGMLCSKQIKTSIGIERNCFGGKRKLFHGPRRRLA